MSFLKHIRSNFKRYLIFGIATFIPAYVTIILLMKVVGFFDGMLVRLFHIVEMPEYLSFLTLPGVGTVLGVVFLVFLGFLSRQYIGRKALVLVDRAFAMFPVSKQVYSALKKMTESFIDKEKTKFQRVVFVPFPHRDVQAIGFLTGRAPEGKDGAPCCYVYVPTAINPTSGFLISVREDQIVHSDMKVDEAFALILSGGLAGARES